MTGIFDGMAGILTGVFGSTVQFAPRYGPMRDVAGVFRETPVEVTGADGQIVVIEAPTWRVPRDLVPEIRRDDLIRLEDARIFRITVVHKAASPARDAFLLCELHEDRP